MAFNGSGTYVLPGAALVDGQTVSATEHNTLRNDMATAFTTCVTRDGQSPATANIPMGGFKHTGLAAGSGSGDSVRYEQVGALALAQGVAALAGSSTQVFSVSPATASTMAIAGSQSLAENIVVNPTFQINNGNAGVAYVSGAVLASGEYGHEMWKAGAGGGDYTFTQNVASTTITIAANKTLIQVIEGSKIGGTSYVLSWSGTAQARYAVNSSTPAGSYAASPIIISGQTIGSVLSIEFNAGTLGEVVLHEGTFLKSARRKKIEEIETECMRYAELTSADAAYRYPSILGVASAGAQTFGGSLSFKVRKYAAPTLTIVGTPTVINCTVSVDAASKDGCRFYVTSTAAGAVTAYFGTAALLATSRL